MAMSFKKTLAFALIVGSVLIIALGTTQSQKEAVTLRAGDAETILRVGNALIRAEIADTPEKKARGLSGRAALGENEGMLFVFEKPGIYSFWMKDMNFPIDIIWLDEYFRVVDISADAEPSSFPNLFTPSAPAQYALEVPGGFAQQHITIGEYVKFALKSDGISAKLK